MESIHCPPFAALVQRQLDAYNAHDAGAFAACFSADVRCQRHPDDAPFLLGREALQAFYARERFVHAALHAHLAHRIDLGARVIDHERVVGLPGGPREVVAIYQQGTDGLIGRVWFVAPA
ncbi:MAG TPA: steroid delta-isomerase [Xanthomonadaceae bacterium]|jgi:putative hydrolase of HD superfamily|nr:steroid delta-isomerase [Xanthomonadaceae bacterium]